MTIKFNDGTTFKINSCIEKITNNTASLFFDIVGDYSASFIQETILAQEKAVYILIDDEHTERTFLNYTQIYNIESSYEDVLANTITEVMLRKM